MECFSNVNKTIEYSMVDAAATEQQKFPHSSTFTGAAVSMLGCFMRNYSSFLSMYMIDIELTTDLFIALSYHVHD
jgi:hypothetical protein